MCQEGGKSHDLPKDAIIQKLLEAVFLADAVPQSGTKTIHDMLNFLFSDELGNLAAASRTSKCNRNLIVVPLGQRVHFGSLWRVVSTRDFLLDQQMG